MQIENHEWFYRVPQTMLQKNVSMTPTALADFINPLHFLPHHNWHEARCTGKWDVHRLLADCRSMLVYSSVDVKETRGAQADIRCAILRVAENVYLTIEGDESQSFRAWASNPALAQSTLEGFRKKYARRAAKAAPSFHIIAVRKFHIERVAVPISRGFELNDATLELNYGEKFCAWQQSFIEQLKTRTNGAAILRGDPGTGKTSFLKHLISRLRATHRFYFLPVDQSPMLTSPEMVDFWQAEKSASGQHLKRVVIIEDAESLVAQRAVDNRAAISNLLNVSEGLLSEFLQLQLLCTINCPLEKIDAAFLRPGRLIGYREFHRLSEPQARRLAGARKLALRPQRDYSLAEIYHSQSDTAAHAGRKIGFAASEISSA